jgi:hypothetical protein
MILTGKYRSAARETVSVQVCSLEILQNMTWDWTRSSVVRSRPLCSRPMTRFRKTRQHISSVEVKLHIMSLNIGQLVCWGQYKVFSVFPSYCVALYNFHAWRVLFLFPSPLSSLLIPFELLQQCCDSCRLYSRWTWPVTFPLRSNSRKPCFYAPF